MIVIAIAALATAFVYFGWRIAVGFALGAAIAYLNFHWLKRTVYAVGEAAAGKPPRLRFAVLLGLRYVLLGLGAYAIVRFSEISLTAALFGLFVPTAAVIVEILIELLYART